jgi:hypothetical protein
LNVGDISMANRFDHAGCKQRGELLSSERVAE